MLTAMQLSRPIQDWGSAEAIAKVAARHPGCSVRVIRADSSAGTDATNPSGVRQVLKEARNVKFDVVGLGANQCVTELEFLNSNGLNPGRTTPGEVRWHRFLDRVEDFCEATFPSWK